MTAPEAEADADADLVRFATRADARTVAHIQIEGWRAAYRGLVPDAILDGFELEPRTARWADLIKRAQRDHTRVWVIADDEAASDEPAATSDQPAATDDPAVTDSAPVVGFAMSGPGRDESAAPPDGAGEIYAIYVLPDVIGRGLGRALFTVATGELLARGYDPILVWVFEDNPRARRFYEAAGFRPDGARHAIDFDGTPIDEIRYRLEG